MRIESINSLETVILFNKEIDSVIVVDHKKINASKLVSYRYNFTTIKYLNFIDATFESVDFYPAYFNYCHFENCNFINCNFAGRFINDSFERCVFTNCEFNIFIFDQCTFSKVSFKKSKFKNVEMYRPSLDYGEGKMDEWILKEVLFENCEFDDFDHFLYFEKYNMSFYAENDNFKVQ